MFTHTKKKPFHCHFPYCKRSYFKKGKLLSHVNIYHLLKNDNLEEKLLLSKTNKFSCETADTKAGFKTELKLSDLINKENDDGIDLEGKEQLEIFF